MKIGFIGVGNMASAIIKGVLSQGSFTKRDIYCYDVNTERLDDFAQENMINTVASNEELIEQVDLILLAIKPNLFKTVLPSLKDSLQKKQPIIVSIAAGIQLETIEKLVGDNLAIIRIMPNVNALIKESVSAICYNEKTTQKHLVVAKTIFNAVGKTFMIAEKDFAAFTAIGGCGPAFVFMFIDALATGGLKNGIPKDVATEIAIQTVLGSAKMLQESDKHAAQLIDMVCSPGGSTIAGVASLEENSFKSTMIQALEATIKRDQEMR
ncbi:pyrroline-5-carboxylate reductase [Erysipelotrichaceae bacterium OttesenSCG-928-M19]|nr:pyrroline-5-carboxylate reductase [Erysipelotrichaceae bacterium OttesenSCG-928-M19]